MIADRARFWLASSTLAAALVTGGCGKSASNAVVSASDTVPGDDYFEIYHSWKSDTRTLELSAQLRKTDENGDILALDGGDTLTLVDVGDLSEIDAAAHEDFAPRGLQYHLLLAGVPNAAHNLEWRRGGVAMATVTLPALNEMNFVSYEYCHAVVGDNYGLARYAGPAPAADEDVCGTVAFQCSGGTCANSMASCDVDDFRIRFVDDNDELSSLGSVRVAMERSIESNSLAGYKGGHYTRKYDGGVTSVGTPDLCTKVYAR